MKEKKIVSLFFSFFLSFVFVSFQFKQKKKKKINGMESTDEENEQNCEREANEIFRMTFILIIHLLLSKRLFTIFHFSRLSHIGRLLPEYTLGLHKFYVNQKHFERLITHAVMRMHSIHCHIVSLFIVCI